MKKRNSIIIVLLTLLAQSSFSQSNLSGPFVLEGDLSAMEVQPTKLTLTYRKLGGGYSFDSCKVVNGKFIIKKELDQPVVLILSTASAPGARMEYFSNLYLAGKATLVAGKHLNESRLSGAATTAGKLYQELETALNKQVEKHNALAAGITGKHLPTPEQELRLQAMTDSIDRETDQEIFYKYIVEHRNSPIAIYSLTEYARRPAFTPRKNIDPLHIQHCLSLLPEAYRKLPVTKALSEELSIAVKTLPGKSAFEFTLPDTAGKPRTLSSYRGKYVLLDFWASWCVPCRKENPNVVKAFHAYGEKGFTVISISLDRKGMDSAWLQAIRKDKLTGWTHLSDLKGFETEAAKQYGVKAIPTNFLIDPAGRFVARNLFGEALENKLAEVFSGKTALATPK